MTSIVVDTSVALKWVLTEDHTTEAIAPRDHCIRENVAMLAPRTSPLRGDQCAGKEGY